MSAYLTMPKEYARELQLSGNRAKARAFMEYCLDLDEGIKNSVRFYAKSWGVSKSTTERWIRHFYVEIEKHHNFWAEKNANNAQKLLKNAGHLRDNRGTPKSSTTTENTEFKEEARDTCGTIAGQRVNNNFTPTHTHAHAGEKTSNTNIEFLREFTELRLRTNKKFLGSKERAYEAYKSVEDLFEIKTVAQSYKNYYESFTNKDEQIVGLAKFINEGLHLSYLPNSVVIETKDGTKIAGTFDLEKESFDAADGRKLKLSVKRFFELLKDKKINFLDEARV